MSNFPHSPLSDRVESAPLPGIPDLAMSRNSREGVAMAIGGTFLFALKSLFIKLAFTAGVNAMTLLTLRMVMSLPFYVLVLMSLDRRRPAAERPSLRQTGSAMALGFLGYYLASYLDMEGLQLISTQLERLTLFCYPTIVACLAWLFLAEPLRPRTLAAIGLSYLGIWIMYGQELADQPGTHVTKGVCLVVGSALSYSAYVLLAKRLIHQIGSLEFTSLAMIGSTLFVIVHYCATESIDQLSRLPGIVWIYGLIIAFLCTVIPSFLSNEAMARIGVTRTTVIGSAGPVLTMLLAILLLGEPASFSRFVGMGAVMIGVSLVARH